MEKYRKNVLYVFSGTTLVSSILINWLMSTGRLMFKLCTDNCTYLKTKVAPILFHNPSILVYPIVLGLLTSGIYFAYRKYGE